MFKPFLDSVATAISIVQAYPGRSFVIAIAFILAGVAEGVGISSLLPILSIATGEGGPATPLEEMVLGTLAWFGLSASLGWLLVLVVIGITLKSMLTLAAMGQVGFAVAQTAADLRHRLLQGLMKARWAFFTQQPIGIFANAISIEANNAASLVGHTARSLALIIQIVIYMGLAILVSWEITAAAFLAGLILFVALNQLVEIARRASRETLVASRELLARMTDGLQGIKPLKAMAAEDRLEPLLANEIEALNRTGRITVIAKEAMVSTQEPILVLFLAIGLYSVATYTAIAFDTVLVMGILFHRTASKFGELQRLYQNIGNSREYHLALEAKIQEAVDAEESTSGRQRPTLTKDIRFENIDFSFGDKKVINQFSIVLPAGKLSTLYGPSGSGKTTIIDLILGFHRPDQGRVLIDGTAIDDIDLKAWRRGIGYVPQELFLFHDTVLNNLTLADPAFSKQEARAALERAGAWKFVSSLAEGLDTLVGERGSMISGGQRQRLAIARALIRHPDLLILDEPTTALDPETEKEICATLSSLARDITVIAISHQPALAAIADNLIRIGGDPDKQLKHEDTTSA